MNQRIGLGNGVVSGLKKDAFVLESGTYLSFDSIARQAYQFFERQGLYRMIEGMWDKNGMRIEFERGDEKLVLLGKRRTESSVLLHAVEN